MSYQHALDYISICMRIHSIFVDTVKMYKSRNYDRVWLLPSMNTQIINGFFFFTTAPFYGMSIVAIFYIIYLCITLHLYTIINYFMIFYLYCIKLNWVCIIFHFSIYTTRVYTFNYHLYYCRSFEHSCIKTQCHKVLVNALFIVCILLFEMIGNII